MRIKVSEGDAEGFIAKAEVCAKGLLRLVRPAEFILVRINNWFGPKWLPFSAPTNDPDAGILAKNLSLPLFVPNRVIEQRNFRAPEYEELAGEPSVHIPTRTSYARQHLMSDLLPSTAILWFSGNSRVNGRGSVLVYLPVGERYHAWYAGWSGSGIWQLVLVKGTAAQDLIRFEEAGVK
jgi:hypothetical protein